MPKLWWAQIYVAILASLPFHWNELLIFVFTNNILVFDGRNSIIFLPRNFFCSGPKVALRIFLNLYLICYGNLIPIQNDALVNVPCSEFGVVSHNHHCLSKICLVVNVEWKKSGESHSLRVFKKIKFCLKIRRKKIPKEASNDVFFIYFVARRISFGITKKNYLQ